MANAPINSVVNLNVPAFAPDGFKHPEVRAAVELMINVVNNILRGFEQYSGATQKDITLWSQLLPTDTLIRHQAGRLYAVASQAVIFGDFVNLHLDAGILKIRKAQATAGSVRPARGYCSTTAGINIGEIGEVILSQGLVNIAGVVIGTPYFLSAVSGQITSVAPVGAGQLEQFVGFGVADNLLYVDIASGNYIQH